MAEAQDREFLSIFLVEAWDTLATLEEGLARLRRADGPGPGGPALEPLVAVSHRLKGAAALHGFPGLADIAGALEQLLERLPAVPPSQRSGVADFLVDLVDVLKRIFDGIGAHGREDAAEIATFRARHPTIFTPPAPTGGSNDAATGLRAELERFFAENADILTYFGPEAAEHLETMTKATLALEQRGRDEEQLATLFRAVHTLKGAAYTVGCGVVGDLAHRVEDLLAAVREERVPLTTSVIEAVLVCGDALRLLLGIADGAPGDLEAVLSRAMDELDRLTPAAEPAPVGESVVGGPIEDRPDTPGPVAGPPVLVGAAGPVETVGADSRVLAARSGIRVNLDRLDALMDLVGELVIARSRLDRRLREMDRIGQLLHFNRSRMAKVVKDFEAKHPHGSLPRPGLSDGAGLMAPGFRPSTSVSQLFAELEFDRYDDFDILARSVAEMSADLGEVQTQLAGLIRTIWEDTGQIQRLTGSLRNEVTRARMVPVGRLFGRFARHVREAARAAGKAVTLQVSGEAVEVDNTVIEQVSDPVLHLIQNAIAHGIESEDERRERGKTPHGTIYLSATHRGGFVYIEVEDDGRGIDGDRIKEQAIRQGFLRAEDAGRLSEREMLNLMFVPGFSTAEAVTTAAGRGVGLDVVRTNVGRLNGEIEVETEPGVGTRFTLKLPLTVVISDALMIRAAAETLAIPLNAVRLIFRLWPEEIQAVGRAEMVRVDGELVELFRLDRLLGLSAGESRPPLPVVVLRASGRSIAVVVDELGNKEEIVIKSLGGFSEGAGPFTGATISGEGRVTLLIDPGRLVELSEGVSRGAVAVGRVRDDAPAARPRPAAEGGCRVLLVDDSVSVRRFVGHMLERAGFRVLTANDGAEALQQLGETKVDVVITDLEMPRVNGYELIEDLRRRSTTRHLPVVVLTTRAGDKHLSLARRLGVEHYVSKPVDEQVFVRLIASLVAPATPEAALSGTTR